MRVVHIQDFVAVVSPDEWAAIRAARELKVRWSDSAPLVTHQGVVDWARRGPFVGEETIVNKGDAARLAALADAPHKLSATYSWPLQSHASMGPSCAVADVKAGSATVWTASQASHRLVNSCAALLQLPREQVRVIYLDGAGCYGMNGHDDATAEAAMLSQARGPAGARAVEPRRGTGLGSQGTAAAARACAPRSRPRAASTPGKPRCGCRAPPPISSGFRCCRRWRPGSSSRRARRSGLVTQNGDPPYAAEAVKVHVHWLGAAPLRPSNIRAPGKVANCFAVESFVDELAARAGVDPIAFRLRDLAHPRGREVIERLARMMQWSPRPSPRSAAPQRLAAGRGMAYIHYKHSETFVAIGMEVEVDRGSGEIRVQRVACAHDCGLMINPDAVRAQVEGNILQTLSRTLHEETTFDASRVTSVDWARLSAAALPRGAAPGHRPGAAHRTSRRWAPAKPPPARCRPRWPTPCSMRPACGCARFPSRVQRIRPLLA